MLNAPTRMLPTPSRTITPRKAAWAVGCIALMLAGCGGSDSAETPSPTPSPTPQPQIAAPANFKVTAAYGGVESLLWNATPGATRYELYADPDGQGPLPEAKLDDYSNSSPRGFNYAQSDSGGYVGSLVNTYAEPSARLNATYRLRGCDATGCGAFTDPQVFDIIQGTSHGFAAGYSPLRTHSDASRLNPVASQDGLTLAIRAQSTGTNTTVLVFTRSSKAQPWVQQAALRATDYAVDKFALSPDGGTLAVRAMKQITVTQGTRVVTDAVHVYQRSGSAWTQQARLDTANAPSGCPQPCQAELAEHMELAAGGNLLAISAQIPAANGGAGSSSAVFTYTRTGATWAPQASLNAEGPVIVGMALSGDGKTLAVTARDVLQPAAPSSVLVLAENGNGAWAVQGRIPATLAVHMPAISGGPQYGSMALSSDGSTLAVNASNLQNPQQCGGAAATSTWGISLYARGNGTWQHQGQAVIADGLPTGWATWAPWALASDGNAVVYGGSMFVRTGGSWVCS